MSLQKVYICTTNALNAGYCTADQLGHFILNLPSGKSINDTSFWSERVQLPANKTTLTPTSISVAEFWNNPSGNPTPPPSDYTSPWRREEASENSAVTSRQTADSHLYEYNGPIHYPVTKTGFYCVGTWPSFTNGDCLMVPTSAAVVPITDEHRAPATKRDDGHVHPKYHGTILFKNVFEGHLAASDYPKLKVCPSRTRPKPKP